jgi:hypothetical protein
VRINSLGNDGSISQTNLVGVGVGANNGSSTSQTGATPAREHAEGCSTSSACSAARCRPAEAAQDKTAANDRSRPAPRRSAPASRPADTTAEKSLGRPVSGAAAAHTAGFPAAAARAPDTKPIGKRHSEHAGGLQRAATSVFARVAHAPLPAVSPPAGQRAAGAGLLTVTVIALLGALLLWLSSTWIGPVRTAWGRRS